VVGPDLYIPEGPWKTPRLGRDRNAEIRVVAGTVPRKSYHWTLRTRKFVQWWISGTCSMSRHNRIQWKNPKDSTTYPLVRNFFVQRWNFLRDRWLRVLGFLQNPPWGSSLTWVSPTRLSAKAGPQGHKRVGDPALGTSQAWSLNPGVTSGDITDYLVETRPSRPQTRGVSPNPEREDPS